MHHVKLELDDTHYNKLRAQAEKRHSSVRAVCQEAIDLYIESLKKCLESPQEMAIAAAKSKSRLAQQWERWSAMADTDITADPEFFLQSQQKRQDFWKYKKGLVK